MPAVLGVKKETPVQISSSRILRWLCVTLVLMMPCIAAAQVSILTGRTVDNVFTLFDPSSSPLASTNPTSGQTPPLNFTLARPSVLLISFSARVAISNPGGASFVQFSVNLDGHPLLFCPGCNPISYESSTVEDLFDYKTIKWVTPATTGRHVLEVVWNIHDIQNPGAGRATVSVKTVVIEASRR